jgi:hypothetical protein
VEFNVNRKVIGTLIATFVLGDKMYTTFTQITPAIHLHRSRLLPVAGTVMVRLGQKVSADDVIAEATIPTHHELVDVMKLFGLSSSKAAEQVIQRKTGEILADQDIIAETGGLFSRVIRTPVPGKIISIREGQVLLETETRKIEILAHYAGVIGEIVPNRGAVIEITGSVIQGAWGNGKFSVGPLLCKAETPSSGLTSANLEITARGSIIASANCNDEKLFDMAASLPIAGLILGSMPALLIEKALAQPYPIMLIEGFGKSGMNSAAFMYLTKYNNHEVTLNAGMDREAAEQQTEALISAAVESEIGRGQSRITSGQLVRIHSAPFLGQSGTIEKALPGLTLLPNGLRVCAASVIMDNKERKTIPVNNLDGIGFTQSNLG